MKKLVVLLMVAMLLCTSLVGCKNDAASNADGERIKITVGYPNADDSWKNDEYFKYITDKLNIDIDFSKLNIGQMVAAIRKDKKQTDDSIKAVLFDENMKLHVYTDLQIDEIEKAIQYLKKLLQNKSEGK